MYMFSKFENKFSISSFLDTHTDTKTHTLTHIHTYCFAYSFVLSSFFLHQPKINNFYFHATCMCIMQTLLITACIWTYNIIYSMCVEVGGKLILSKQDTPLCHMLLSSRLHPFVFCPCPTCYPTQEEQIPESFEQKGWGFVSLLMRQTE